MIFKYSIDAVSYTTDFPVTIVNTSNTQAILKYDSPTRLMCTIKVSESADLSNLVNDVNPNLFANADKDTRDTSVVDGNSKIVVIGKRLAEEALDGNYYSRALQAYTVHYYQITCGSKISSGSFETKTIPTGLTYSDTIRGKSDGSPAWPTIKDERDQIIIDPQTGLKITRASLISDNTSSTGTYTDNLNFGASANTDVCSDNLVADSNGNMGYHCLINIALFWINPTTGEARPIGVPASLYDNVNFGALVACNKIDPENGNFFYCIRNTISGKTVIVRLEYKGQNTFLNRELPNCTGSNEPCVESTILTPETGNNDLISLIKNFDPDYPDNFNTEGYLPIVYSIQNGKIIIQHLRSIQDSYAWYIVFDTGNGTPVGQPGSTAGVIAAMSTYKNYPIRWCSDHGVVPIGGVDWIYTISNNLRGGTSQAGYGMYTSTIVEGNLPNTTYSCPANSFNDNLCTDIIVDGEPCDEDETPQNYNAKCGVSSHSYLQDAEIGDLFGIAPNPSRGSNYKEYVRLIAKSGNNWTVSRGINQTSIISHSTGTLDAVCTVNDTGGSPLVQNISSWAWNFIDDPHGNGPLGTNIIYDRNATGGHSGYRPNKMIEISGLTQYQIRSGSFPSIINASKTIINDGNPSFSGVQGIGTPNTLDSHPSPFYNDVFFLDGRTMNSGISYSQSAINLGSGLYKYPSGSITINRKKMATIAYSGIYILKDISGRISDITTANDHSYCVVENNNECIDGSLVGEVYVKSTTANNAECPFPGVAITGWDQQHICIGDNSMYNQAIAQIGPNLIANGKNGRMLTHGLTRYNRQDVFWNIRATPDGSGMLFTLPIDSTYGEGSGQLFYAKLPPFTTDNHIRDDFVNTTVEVPNSTNENTDSASILFGYTEEGSKSDYFCTSRRESCIKGSHSGVDYEFGSTTSSRVSCADGCNISVPIIPGRVAYMQIQYHDSNGIVIATSTPLVTMSEYPYTVVKPLDTTDYSSSGQGDGGGIGGGGQNETPTSGGGGGSSGSSRRNSSTASVVLSNVNVKNEENTTNTTVMSRPLGLVFTRRITTKTKGDDVAEIQKILATRPDIYPEGLVTGYYGPLTTKAIKRFQLMYKVTRPHIYGYGIIGPLTINKMNQVFKISTTTESQ